MERRLLAALGVLLVGVSSHAAFDLDASVEAALVRGGPMPSFQDGSQGKLRYGRDDDGLQFLSGYVQIQSDFDAVWNAKLAVDLNAQSDAGAGIIDAFMQYRPLPWRGLRFRAKVGAFRPPLSFEHGADGWATLYTTNASAINSWVGEELGGLGVELTLKHDIASSDSPYYWAASAAAFQGNDTAGTLLSWRGWSVNNWQTQWGGTIELAPLPLFDRFQSQAPRAEPFLELDDHTGYYGWAEIGRVGRFRLRSMHWENRADPTVRGHGQTGWCTLFNSVSLQIALPYDIGLIAQWLEGVTYIGRLLPSGKHVLDNRFESYFALLTRAFGRHRVSARVDRFRVLDRDVLPDDPNDESGSGLTLSYQFEATEHWLLGLEWVRIDSRRPARVFEDAPVHLIEDAVFAVARWTL